MRDRVKGRFEPLSDFAIEAYLCGDTDSTERAAIEAQVQASPELAAFIAERRAEDAAFFTLHPRLTQTTAPSRSFKWRTPWLWGLASAAMAAALLIAVVPTTPSNALRFGADHANGGSEIRARGPLKASLTVRRGQRIFAQRPGVLLRRGDQVRVSVESPVGGYLTVLSQDVGGKLSVLYDALPTTAGTFTAPGSLVLDDYIGVEQWYVILASTPQPAASYLDKLRRGAAIDAATARLHIVKEEAP